MHCSRNYFCTVWLENRGGSLDNVLTLHLIYHLLNQTINGTNGNLNWIFESSKANRFPYIPKLCTVNHEF